MDVRESLPERLADEWRQEERTIVKGGILLFTVILLAVFLTIALFADVSRRDAAIFSFVTFAVPCWAAVVGGFGLYHDHRGDNTAARQCFVASYLALLFVMFYFVLAHDDIPKRAGMAAAIVMTLFSISANVLLIRRKKATPGARWLMVVQLAALMAIVACFFMYP